MKVLHMSALTREGAVIDKICVSRLVRLEVFSEGATPAGPLLELTTRSHKWQASPSRA